MKTCAIIGGASLKTEPTPEQLTAIKKIAGFLGRKGFHILTGACKGLPHYFGKACIEAGCRVTGYCPAPDLKTHTEIIGYPADGCTDFVFLKDLTIDPDSMFLQRSLPMMEEADYVLSLGGNWGTLFELVSAIINGKTIICWTEFGGITAHFQDLYHSLKKENMHPYDEVVLQAATPDEVITRLSSPNENLKDKELEKVTGGGVIYDDLPDNPSKAPFQLPRNTGGFIF